MPSPLSAKSRTVATQQANEREGLSLKKGLVCALGCYALWGFLPLYWKLLAAAPYLEILAHRMFWSCVFMWFICRVFQKLDLKTLFRDRRALKFLGAAGVIVTFNWGLFIYAVNSGHVLQVALGYYINPLVSILLGVLVFHERLTTVQKIATGLAALGVLYFTIDFGSFPWVSLSLAVSFAVYGALKKKGGYAATPALAVETTLVAPLAVAFVVATFFMPQREFLAVTDAPASWLNTLLLIGGGALTAIPLVLFAKGANAIPLSYMGFIQYLSPTISLLLGVFAFGEYFTLAHAVCFVLIWTGLIMTSIEVLRTLRRRT